nr:MAG TPA_asm: Head Tail Connector Protein [Caudoviricetes sp.]
MDDEILKEFKSRMHIFHEAEDESLKAILSISYEVIKNECGDFDINAEPIGKELVFERSRYVYNEQLQFFNKNFSTLITEFAILNQIYGSEDDYGDIQE